MATANGRSIEGQAAIITGASSGIGEATARALAAAGANVALAARRKERLDDLKSDIDMAEGGSAIVVETDVTDKEQVQALAEKTLSAFGHIDILINNAGIMPLSYMKNLHEEEWEQMVDVNVKGVLFCIGAVLPQMLDQESGFIVNVSSEAGRRIYPGGAVYSGTKFFVRALTQGMRSELAPECGIRVTNIEPGTVDTELAEAITDEELMSDMEGFFDMKQMESEDLADAILYAIQSPEHVDIEELLIMPTEQG